MQIRKAQAKDKKDLTKLLLDFYFDSQKRLSKTQARFRKYSSPIALLAKEAGDYISNKYLTFISEEGGKLTGFITGEVKVKKNRIYNKEGYVEKWYVDPNYQSKGLGKKLFDTLAGEFIKAGCTHIALDTHLENKKIIEIYRHMGFKKRLVTFFKILEKPT